MADLFAILVTAATLALRMALNGPLEGEPTLVIFTVPIMLSAYVGQVRAGLLATTLSFFGACFFLLPPHHSFAVGSTAYRWDLVLVVAAGVTISVLSEAVHWASWRAVAAVREHQRVEAALRESEERFHALVDWSPESLAVTRGGETRVRRLKRARVGLEDAVRLLGPVHGEGFQIGFTALIGDAAAFS